MTTVFEQETPDEKTVLVFQLWEGDEGIFFTKEQYVYLKTIESALERAKTWREFEALLPPGEFDTLRLWEDEEYIYRDGEIYRYIDPNKVAEFVEYWEPDNVVNADDTFNKWIIPGVQDAEYPPWTEWTAVDLLPKEFVEQFGSWVGGPASGSWCEFPADQLKDMIKCLGQQGYSVIPHISFDLSWLRQIELTR